VSKPITPVTPILSSLKLTSENVHKFWMCHSVSRFERVHYRAALNWLTKYESMSEASNLEKIRGYLEAFYHFCEIEDWQRAETLINFSFENENTGTVYKLIQYLEIWGYYPEQIEMLGRLNSEKVPLDICVLALIGLGNTYSHLSNYSHTIELSKTALELSEKTGNIAARATALINLGIAYAGFGKFKRSMHYFQESLSISKHAGLLEEQAKVLGNLGNLYGSQRKYREAINYFEKSLVIAREMQDHILEAKALGNLGAAYGFLRQYDRAATYLEGYRATSQELENPSGQIIALNNLGELYRRTKQYDKAISCLTQSLSMAKELKEVSSESFALGNLGSVHGRMGDYHKAIDYHQQALRANKRISDPQGIFLAQLNLRLTQLVLWFSQIRRRNNQQRV
jgi:tetratricopeptide (TPR) repeat protein